MAEFYMDPKVIERMIDAESYNNMWYREETPQEEIDILRGLVSSLDEEDQELYDLLYVQGKTQQECCELLNVTQGLISYRISKITERLRVIKELPKIEPKSSLTKISKDIGLTQMQIDAVQHFFKSKSQKVTAEYIADKYNKKFNNSQVRNILLSTVKKIEKEEQKLQDLRGYLNIIFNECTTLHKK